MIPVTLPDRPDREALVGFWASLALLGGMAVGALALAVGLAPLGLSLGIAAVGAGTFFLAGYRKERMIGRIYRRWTRVAGKRYAPWALGAVTAIWYWTVFAVLSRTGEGGLEVRGRAWQSRGTLTGAGYDDPSGGAADRGADGGVREFAAWTVRSGRPWALVLVPLFALVRALNSRGGSTAAPNIYTLY